MNETRTINIGVVGAGANTRRMHLPRLMAIDGVNVVAVVNRSRASSESVAAQFDIATIYDDWRALVVAPDTDAIVIGTWPYLHCPATLAALEAGKHVLVEARMAMNVDEAQRMFAASRARPELVAQVVPAPLSFGVDATVRRLVAEGFLGDILAIEVRDHGGRFLDRASPLHWRQDVTLSGVNMLNLGIWYETLLRWVGEATAVLAMGQTFVKSRLHAEHGGPVAVRLPEHLVVVADMACGATATFSMSQVTGLRPVQEIVLHGSDGTLRFADGALAGGRRGDDALHPIDIPAAERDEWRVEEMFIDAIRGVAPVQLTTFETGVKYMRFSDAVARSLAEGGRVALPL